MSAGQIEVRLACIYRRSWQDGFGARGWKLATAETDPEVIASTAATGDRIPTSVFVHDILDHALCGLGSSGHRNEAVALLQLSDRTGADPMPDFAQMVDEDLMSGHAVGESLLAFLPHDLALMVPANGPGDDGIIGCLEAQLGRETLRNRLIGRLFELGEAGAPAAREQYSSHGLDYRRRAPLGLALQGLLEQADAVAQDHHWTTATATVWITDRRCGFAVSAPESWSSERDY